MRITTGKHKGRKLKFISEARLRPTMDKIRKAVFDVLGGAVEDLVFLDLFAGTGAMGIEALSRGARKAYFIEKDRKNIKLVTSNLEALCIPYKIGTLKNIDEENICVTDIDSSAYSEVFCVSAEQFIKKTNLLRVFDIIYLDPPYDEDVLKYLSLIKKYDSLNENGLLIIETRQKVVLNNDFVLIKEKKYGDKQLMFGRLV